MAVAANAALQAPPPALEWASSAPWSSTYAGFDNDSDSSGGVEDWDRRYERLGMIGHGNFGVVFQARNRETGELVAVKWQQFGEHYDSIPSYLLREISLLRVFEHPNVVKLLDVQFSEGGGDCFLAFEYVDMDLSRVLAGYKGSEQLPMPQVESYSQQLLNGIHACHLRLIIHRDLKPQNILVGQDGVLKICDFGLARLSSPPLRQYTLEVTTLWYRAPEILLGSSVYGPEVDMWSAGCVISEMLVGRVLFMGDSEIGTIFRIFGVCGTPTEETWPGISRFAHWRDSFPKWPPAGLETALAVREGLGESGIALVRGMLSLNPRGRLMSRQAKGHEFFRQRRLDSAVSS
mmetsp:Transcript_67340/g.186349  ORF Transcript_67340/g.186349 Transcript_67340/m.186349 type:complete len:348 (+) Transcript_67340:41-1084(+)